MAGLLAIICFTATGITSAQANKRVALLLGAERYQHFKSSNITVAQNRALEKALLARGFDVMLVADPGNAAARAALAEFSRKAAAAEFAVIVATGHFTTYRRQTFFLPVNARIRRATDLFSRGLSVANIADISHRAKSGALLMMMTVPDIPSTIAGITTQPDFATAPPDNVVAAFSSSSQMPVSRVDSVSAQAMQDLITVASNAPLRLSSLVDRAAARGQGRIVGAFTDRNLSGNATQPEPPKSASPPANERKNRELIEEQLNKAITRAQRAEERAREIEARAKRELAAATLDANRRVAAAKRDAEAQARRDLAAAARKAEAIRRADAANAKRELEKAVEAATRKTMASIARTQSNKIDHSTIQSLQVVEALLGPKQRQVIQRFLKSRGHYRGPLDSVFSKEMREAIRDFQRQLGDEATGYMTPAQFQRLVAEQ